MRNRRSDIKLSVLIVSYNEEKFLEECFDSILNQKVDFEYEVIVGDDGSSDNSISIIKSYEHKFKHFKYFIQDREPGLNKSNVIASIRASNVVFKAISMSEGQYLNVVSGDDYFIDKTFYQKSINFLDNHKSYSAYISSFCMTYPDGSVEDYVITSKKRFSFWYKQYVHLSCFVFKNLKNDNVLLNSFCDDCGLQYSIGLNGKLKYTEDVTFAYRQREKSIMHSNDREELDICEMMLFQDILNKKLPSLSKSFAFFKLYILSLLHFKGPFLSLYGKRGRLDEEKYQKYTSFFSKFGNDLIGSLIRPNEKEAKLLLHKVNERILTVDWDFYASNFIIFLFIKKLILRTLNKTRFKILSKLMISNKLKSYKNKKIIKKFSKYEKKHFCFAHNIDSEYLKGEDFSFSYICGWACIKNNKDVLNTEKWISYNGKYEKMKSVRRSDVRKVLDLDSVNTGFEFKTAEAIKDYDIVLVDKKNKTLYFQPMSRELNVSDFITKKVDIKYSIDKVKISDLKTEITGWAIFGDSESEVCVESNGKFYVTEKLLRPDVRKAFSEELDREDVGFSFRLNMKIDVYCIVLVNRKDKIIYKGRAI
ncbi:glycosyltransferase family 2 protein [Treponema sp.]|uniref:glycosyltransferase family 2 protein n=1 Tax=Treponema sp. TaxID=166 RepID=UPI00298E7CF6|nr:glycosyltransferase family 2 protein [Treponema sp.]MCQ2241391.1 glycosyltransferase [Treponema sp.]